MNKTDTIARMHRDGTVAEVLPDGTERPFPDTPMRPMTEAEVAAAAAADPDARPITEEEFQRARKVPSRCRSSSSRSRGWPPHTEKSRVRVVAAGLTDADIDRLIKQAQRNWFAFDRANRKLLHDGWQSYRRGRGSQMNRFVPIASPTIPVLVAGAGDRARIRFRGYLSVMWHSHRTQVVHLPPPWRESRYRVASCWDNAIPTLHDVRARLHTIHARFARHSLYPS